MWPSDQSAITDSQLIVEVIKKTVQTLATTQLFSFLVNLLLISFDESPGDRPSQFLKALQIV